MSLYGRKEIFVSRIWTYWRDGSFYRKTFNIYLVQSSKRFLSQKQIIFDYFPDFWNLHNNEIFELKWETCVSKSKCFDPFGFDLCVCVLILIIFCSEADGAFHPLKFFHKKRSDMLPVKQEHVFNVQLKRCKSFRKRYLQCLLNSKFQFGINLIRVTTYPLPWPNANVF